MAWSLLVAGLAGLLTLGFTRASQTHAESSLYCPVFYYEPPSNCEPLPESFLDVSSGASDSPSADIHVLEDAFSALVVLQDRYFDANFGTWPSTIDWTGAVTETVISGILTSLTKALAVGSLSGIENWKAKENLISSFYAQVVSSYFGQDTLSIRGQVRSSPDIP